MSSCYLKGKGKKKCCTIERVEDKSSQTSNESPKNVERRIIKSFTGSVKKFTEELDKGRFSKTNSFKTKIKEKFCEAKEHVKLYSDDLSMIMLVLAIEAKENVAFIMEEAKPYLDQMKEQGKKVGKGFVKEAGKVLEDIKEEILI